MDYNQIREKMNPDNIRRAMNEGELYIPTQPVGKTVEVHFDAFEISQLIGLLDKEIVRLEKAISKNHRDSTLKTLHGNFDYIRKLLKEKARKL